MKNSSHTGHFLGGGRVEFYHAAVGDRRFDGNGIQHPGKVEVGGILRLSTHLQRAIHAWCIATNRRNGRWHVCSFGGIILSRQFEARPPGSPWPTQTSMRVPSPLSKSPNHFQYP